MPVPFILAGLAVAAGAAGIIKGGEAISNNSKAKDLVNEAQRIYDEAKERLDYQRIETTGNLDSLGRVKLEAWSGEIGSFIQLFKTFKNVSLQGNVELNEKLKMQIANPQSLKNMKTASLKASEVMRAGIGSLGAGALAGIASYGGAMMFASASTGTAIASLSGIAATNATMAWFGGGSLAAGGLGMAGGSMVLGGIVAGPVLAVAGFIMAAKSEENLANAQKTHSEAKNAAEKINIMTDFMTSVSAIASNHEGFICEFRSMYAPVLSQLKEVQHQAYVVQETYLGNRIKRFFCLKVKIDFRKLSMRQQQVLHISWLMAQVLYSVLSAPILTQQGDLDLNAETVLTGANESVNKISIEQQRLEQIPEDVSLQKMIPYKQENDSVNATTITRSVSTGKNETGAVLSLTKRLLHFIKLMVLWSMSILFVLAAIGTFTVSIPVGVAFLVVSALFCPLLFRKQKTWVKVLMAVGLWIGSGFFLVL
ncbi:hypothetical protein [Lacrimispora celerecrescens]|uniref:Uncharacterized protein n=1 Tax=[Clostridium] celerecrescens 18A TaxID=1286362 RepID=A0A2M8Z6Y6_9FIRM|nr:hypothetical protein [Lacrimispora celerecrescens]PJJ29207.1 hypothetical protein H171_2745 [[Clostridium] celerecrescens 18A]